MAETMWKEGKDMDTKFEFAPAPWLPFRDKEVLQYVRTLPREKMMPSAGDHPEFEIKIVQDVQAHFVTDLYYRIRCSDKENKKLTVVLPNPFAAAYQNVARLCNQYQISCRNLHVFFLNEYADQNGEVAPVSYERGLGHSFQKYFYNQLEQALRMPEEQVHYFTTENVAHYSDDICACGNGGADVMYTSVGWIGRLGSIEPNGEFSADSMEDYLKLGSKLVTPMPESIAEDSLMGLFGCSGDVAAVPPKAATIGPRDVAQARDHIELQYRGPLGMGTSWQRQISRLMLYGPITQQVPSSMLRLFKGTAYVSEDIAKPAEVPPNRNPLQAGKGC